MLLFLYVSVLIGCGGDEAVDTDAADTEPTAVQAAAGKGTVVVGSIQGTLGDDDRSWSALYMEGDGDAGAQTRDMGRRTVHMLWLGGHTGTSLRINESLRININTTEPLADCPCSIRNQSIEYWIDAADRYEAREAVVTVDRFEDTGKGEYQASGRFSGTLARLSPGDERPTGETLAVEGTFDIDRILRKQAGSKLIALSSGGPGRGRRSEPTRQTASTRQVAPVYQTAPAPRSSTASVRSHSAR